MSVDIALIGATGMVGGALLEILAERDFPVGTLYPLSSARSEGETVVFGKRNLGVQALQDFDFSQVQLALFAAGAEVAAEYAPQAAATGCIVIDNSAHFRQQDTVPLVVPEVNSERLRDYDHRNIIANPNCVAIQLAVAIKPIYDAVGVTSVNVCTYQAVSGSGKGGVSELVSQTTQLLNGRAADSSVYPRQIAFNVLPHIDHIGANGYTGEETKIIEELQKILEDPHLVVNPTAVRVPVIYGHSAAVTLQCGKPLTAAAARSLLAGAAGIEVCEEAASAPYPTPIPDLSGNDAVLIGRIRNTPDLGGQLNFWVVADNVRKGAALNAVQIAEILLKKYI